MLKKKKNLSAHGEHMRGILSEFYAKKKKKYERVKSKQNFQTLQYLSLSP